MVRALAGLISLFAPSSSINCCFTGSYLRFLPSRKAIIPRLTIEHDLWPFDSLRANFFLVLTDSVKVPICGSGSGSESISFCRSGM